VRSLTDAARLVGRLEGELVAVRLRRDRRWIHGRCLAVGGRPTTSWRRGARYLLIEVHEHAGVQEPQPPPRETAAERQARFAAQRAAIHVPLPKAGPDAA
jgi:hypothetical protein